jgi:hypothetical protein
VAPPICNTEGPSWERADGSHAEAARPDSERTADLLVNAVLPPAAVSIVSAKGQFPNIGPPVKRRLRKIAR